MVPATVRYKTTVKGGNDRTGTATDQKTKLTSCIGINDKALATIMCTDNPRKVILRNV